VRQPAAASCGATTAGCRRPEPTWPRWVRRSGGPGSRRHSASCHPVTCRCPGASRP